MDGEIRLSSEHRIRNSNPGEAEHVTSRSRRLPPPTSFTSERRKNIFVSLKLEGQSGIRTRDLRLPKQAVLPLHQGPRPSWKGMASPDETQIQGEHRSGFNLD